MIKIGINGFGRIGKCCFLQLIFNEKFNICCLNALNINIHEIEDYLRYDSTHTRYNRDFDFKIISDNEFKIRQHSIHLISERNAENIDWKKYGCEYIIDATGVYLTTKKCLSHNVDYIIMSAPSKDDTKTFIYGVNNNNYSGEKIVSGSSCTTNCLTPMLKILNDTYKIQNCVFTTIHATTASQYTVDIVDKSLRTNRSIFNNIIPHTTGASSSVTCVLPELIGKINGTSIRVPVLNCSLLDLNVELENTCITLKDIISLLKASPLYKTVFDISEKKLVSCDFVTTTTPTILDINASIDMGNGKFKLMLWYDNEWSYSAQLIRLIESMNAYNLSCTSIKKKYFMKNLNIENKGVICRLDLNVPINDEKIIDDYRIQSAIPTIEYILKQSPKYLVLTSHFGRPKGNGYEEKYSLKFLAPILEKYLNKYVKFLENGISEETLSQLHRHPFKQNLNSPCGVYLLENLRFNKVETEYENMTDKDIQENKVIQMYSNLGDIFIGDAFGCLHRKHMSICAMKDFGKPYGYGYLIQKETDTIELLTKNTSKRVLAIIGGNKIKDKLPIIDSFRHLKNAHIFVAGGLAKQYKGDYENVSVMFDGFGNDTLDMEPLYISSVNETNHNVFDIGAKSLEKLFDLINNSDVIFWNGSLGVIENEIYRKGSANLAKYLQNLQNKTIIIGGGETASLIENKNINMYVSTGGGALLEFIEKRMQNNNTLTGLELFI